MKRLLPLTEAPSGLSRFRADTTQEQTWQTFSNFEHGAPKRELVAALTLRQRGLCCYCEIGLRPDETQIEHVVPRSDPKDGLSLTLDPSNLLACCKGGTDRNFKDDTLQPDPARYLPPVPENISCGQAKDNQQGPPLSDPRNLPDVPSPFVVRQDGRIEPDLEACNAVGVSVSDAKETIRILGLDSQRLRNQRTKIWAELAKLPTEPAILVAAAQQSLRPQATGALFPWFTTRRSFFGPLSEALLARPPQDWISA